MPRNSGGTYSLPAGNPVVTGTTVSSTWANSTLSDIAAELTNSLARDGSGSMDAPLLLPNGTGVAPALAFASEITTGLYLAGAQDMRLQVNATNAVTMTSSGVSIPLGLVVTQDTTDGPGVTGTGNGTGYGGDFNGGGSNGVGVRGTGQGSGAGGTFTGGATGTGVTGSGGATSGVGVVGVGTGASAGVSGTGGPTNGHGVSGAGTGVGHGVSGTGGATGAGIRGTGGATSGAGGVFTATAGNSEGVTATGQGSGAGVDGIGGAGGGIGVYGVGGAPNGPGVHGQGTGTGAGGRFFNLTGATSAAIEGWSNSSTAGGGFFNNGSGGPAIQVNEGNVKFTGSNPAASTGFVNTLTPKNIAKAWGHVAVTAGSIGLDDGFNIAAVSLPLITGGLTIVIDFAAAMANANYAVTTSVTKTSGSNVVSAFVFAKSASQIQLRVYGATVTAGNLVVADLSAVTCGVSFIVMGAQ